MGENTEVEITSHHRPTEYVKAFLYGYTAGSIILILTALSIERPNSFASFVNCFLYDFAFTMILIIVGVILGLAAYVYIMTHKTKIVDAGQFGTYVVRGKKAVELPPLHEGGPAFLGNNVTLVSPSEKSGDYLSYAKIAGYLQSVGLDVNTIEENMPEIPLLKEDHEEHEDGPALSSLQQVVLDSWNKGNHGIRTVSKDTGVSVHMAAKTLNELRGKGAIE
jgi:hypothetical protein